MKEIVLGPGGMSLEDLVAVARGGARVRLADESTDRIREARELVERWVREERVIYGVTTGFGALSNVTISAQDARRLQEKHPHEPCGRGWCSIENRGNGSHGVQRPEDPEVGLAIKSSQILDGLHTKEFSIGTGLA